jgi:NADPH-dependent 2,4-dienoyl-CoA reductase/sulfur reductase-like enzyme
VRVLILGAGPAGLTAAGGLRELAPAQSLDPEITIVSAEPGPPYSPPAMADYFLTGRDSSLYWQGPDICQKLRVNFRSGVAVQSVIPHKHCVVLRDGGELEYDRLVIATGSRLFAPLDGYDLPGAYNFKSLTAARDLVEHARRGEVRTALIVGAGFIGVEVALLLRSLGLDVTMVERHRVMPNVLDEETSKLVLDELERRDITVRLRTEAVRFTGHDRVTGVALDNGEILHADAYIAATGVKPNVDYLDGSGLDIGWGVRVDNKMRTNLPDTWAAGDVAESVDRVSGERFVHAIWPNARSQGEIVARDILGYATDYQGAEQMNSMKHLGLPIIAAGKTGGDRVLRLRRGDSLRKIFLTKGRIVGFQLAGDIRGAGTYRALMLRNSDVSQFGDELLDPRFGIHRCLTAKVLRQPAITLH